MTRTLIMTAGAAALLLAGAGQAQTRTHRSPSIEAYGLDGALRIASEGGGGLAGGPAEGAGERSSRIWSVRSSHVPADVEDVYGYPAASRFIPQIAVIADVEVDAEHWGNRWDRGPRWRRAPDLRGDRFDGDGRR